MPFKNKSLRKVESYGMIKIHFGEEKRSINGDTETLYSYFNSKVVTELSSEETENRFKELLQKIYPT